MPAALDPLHCTPPQIPHKAIALGLLSASGVPFHSAASVRHSVLPTAPPVAAQTSVGRPPVLPGGSSVSVCELPTRSGGWVKSIGSTGGSNTKRTGNTNPPLLHVDGDACGPEHCRRYGRLPKADRRAFAAPAGLESLPDCLLRIPCKRAALPRCLWPEVAPPTSAQDWCLCRSSDPYPRSRSRTAVGHRTG